MGKYTEEDAARDTNSTVEEVKSAWANAKEDSEK